MVIISKQKLQFVPLAWLFKSMFILSWPNGRHLYSAFIQSTLQCWLTRRATVGLSGAIRVRASCSGTPRHSARMSQGSNQQPCQPTLPPELMLLMLTTKWVWLRAWRCHFRHVQPYILHNFLDWFIGLMQPSGYCWFTPVCALWRCLNIQVLFFVWIY